MHGGERLLGKQVAYSRKQIAFRQVLVHGREQGSVLPCELLRRWHEQGDWRLLGVRRGVPKFVVGPLDELSCGLGLADRNLEQAHLLRKHRRLARNERRLPRRLAAPRAPAAARAPARQARPAATRRLSPAPFRAGQ